LQKCQQKQIRQGNDIIWGEFCSHNILPLPFYGPLFGTTQVSPYQKEHSPTHTYPNHQSSFICFLHLMQSAASSLFNNYVTEQSLLYNLCPCFLWSTSWSGTVDFILYTFLHPIIVFFLQHMLIPSQPVLL